MATATGCWLTDVHGRSHFDATAGSGAVNLGHAHPAVIAACERQLRRTLHLGWNIAIDIREDFARSLVAFSPIAEGQALFCVTGAEAIEAALKIAHAATGRHWSVAFESGFHGKTAGALSVTWREGFRRYSALRDTGTLFAALADEDSAAAALDALETSIAARARESGPPAAIVVEPVQCAEGVFVAGSAFLKGLRRLADRIQAVLIFDEIYTGFGRTGRCFVAGDETCLPDLLVVGKALGNGIPVSAVLGSRDIMSVLPPGAHSSTFAAHPLACAAGRAVLKTMADTQPWHSAARLGAVLRHRLAGISRASGRIGAPRGSGLMLAFECCDADGQPDPAAALSFLAEARAARLVLRGGGRSGATIKLTPPLTMDDGECAFLADTIATIADRLQDRHA